MTREDIIRMARESGAATGSPAPNAPEIIFTQCLDVERFAALVAAAEREACMGICDEAAEDMTDMAKWGAQTCSKLIKARGQA